MPMSATYRAKGEHSILFANIVNQYFQRQIPIFTNNVLCSALALYVADIGIDVIFIGVAQQQKTKFSLP